MNNDGLLDLLALNFIASASSTPVASRVYLNQADGVFRSADAGGLTRPYYAYGWGGWADYDNDGYLDAFLGTAWADTGHRTNVLFQGRGDGTFGLVTNCVIATDRISSGFSNDANWGDFNNDGLPDLIVANVRSLRDFLYRNDGHGQFTRLTNSILEKYVSGHHAWGDYDNDGFLDLAQGYFGGARLFRNNAGGDFVSVTNLAASEWNAPVWADYDNDGYLDLLVSRDNGAQLRLFHNDGDGAFTRVEDAFTRPSANWMSASWGDYDNDGFLDLFVAEQTGKNALYHNLGNSNHWIKFQLEGVVANRSAIGAKVRVRATIGGKTFWQMRELSASGASQNELRPNFGLGDATNVLTLRIEWPSGAVQELANVAPRQLLTIWEPPALRGAVLADCSCQLTVTAEPNRAWRIEASTDLKTWQALTIVTSANVKFQYTDNAANGMVSRFYRVVGP
ncbi:MAG: CRTAC1 family protein [Verrucomicrobiia bacterium]